MISIKPFRAYRPRIDYAMQVVALPYDVISEEEARRIGESNPYSFLHIDKPEVFYKGQELKKYEYARNILEELIEVGILIQEESPCLYIYGLITSSSSQYGIVGCLSCREYDEGKIKRHEKTREDKEQDRFLHIEECQAHTGPIFLACKEEAQLKAFIERYRLDHKPLYDFEHEGVRQLVYCIENPHEQAEVIACFNKMKNLYVADGHHRLAAAASYARVRRKEVFKEEGEYEDFLGVIFPKSDLNIIDYNRVIQDESELSEEALMNAIEKQFNITQMKEQTYHPSRRHHIGMRYKGSWYNLSLKDNQVNEKDPVARLDTAILQDLILEPIFHIKNPRTDKRIDFIGGIKGIEALNRRTDEDMDIAFALCPTTMDELIQVADANRLMPPKSTWFEPKLRSGLFIHRF
ncbi:MAG: DUF1015 domain-containing protein [Niameybacter sp.]|nr:DUF1015 domain-containing protein [Niameybacter sp.]